MRPFAKLTLTRRAALLSAAAAVLPLRPAPLRAEAQKFWRKTYGLSSFGDLAMPADFTNFPYASRTRPRAAC